jgi:lipopolysaccharide export LptBFGC system permease protein LptF
MKKRALILSSFAFLLSAFSYGQESRLSSTQLTKAPTKSRSTVAQHAVRNNSGKLAQNSPNTIESIDQEIQTLENVLIINKDDRDFNREAVNKRIAELKEQRKNLTN